MYLELKTTEDFVRPKRALTLSHNHLSYFEGQSVVIIFRGKSRKIFAQF